MPLLGADDALPYRPRRVLVTGTSGSGKTTLATRIAETLDLPRAEIDGLFHGPGWTPRPSFVDEVHEFAAQPGWVTEWQYDQVRDHLADRADLLVWLDLPRWRVMTQIVRRTLRRRLRREQLWNGNIEPPLRTVLTDADHIVRWAWRTHRRTTARVHELQARCPDLPVVRLRGHAESARWVAGRLQT